jgi:2-polyprenyl-6-methoxyphenol hydroxylase-like FAD-dependent oxidoreductase
MYFMTTSERMPPTRPSSAFVPRESRHPAVACSKVHYDALVFGKGPAACIFAIEMVRRGKTVLLVPPNTESNQEPWGETLTPRGEFLLAQAGLLQNCLAGQHAASKVLACWNKPDPRVSDLAFDPHGRMWHLDRPMFDRALLIQAIQTGVNTLDGWSCRVDGLTRHKDHWEVPFATSHHQRVVQFDQLIDATGRSHKIARLRGAKRILRDRLAAISCIHEESYPTAPLLIEAVRQGWWYSLSLPNGELFFALITDPKSTKLSGRSRNVVWDAMLEEAPYTRARNMACDRNLRVVSAETSRLDRMYGEGWLAIGDAAMSFDPLSSHGLCGAIEDAICAAEIFSQTQHDDALAEFDVKRIGFFSRYIDQRRTYYQSAHRFSGYAFWENRLPS